MHCAFCHKDQTTENYGDAWFVGYTPQIAVAVWVGYPDGLKPMLHEFGGKAVTGGFCAANQSAIARMSSRVRSVASGDMSGSLRRPSW